VPSNLPFSRNIQQTFEKRKSNNSSLEFPVIPTVALQGLRKLELTQQRVARIENFRYHCEIAPFKSSGLSFPQKVQLFVRNEKSEAFWNYVRNLQSSRPLLDPFTKIFFNLQLVAASHLFFVSRVSLRNVFFET
jgi:hypothetical protein